jgi:hypothetical protein
MLSNDSISFASIVAASSYLPKVNVIKVDLNKVSHVKVFDIANMTPWHQEHKPASE